MCDSFQHRRIVRARTIHQCESCRRWIQSEELYVAMAGKWDGDFYAVELCQGCESLWELIWAVDGERKNWLSDGLAFHEVMEVGEEMGLICCIPNPVRLPPPAQRQ